MASTLEIVRNEGHTVDAYVFIFLRTLGSSMSVKPIFKHTQFQVIRAGPGANLPVIDLDDSDDDDFELASVLIC